MIDYIIKNNFKVAGLEKVKVNQTKDNKTDRSNLSTFVNKTQKQQKNSTETIDDVNEFFNY
jgi:hypothetical protein